MPSAKENHSDQSEFSCSSSHKWSSFCNATTSQNVIHLMRWSGLTLFGRSLRLAAQRRAVPPAASAAKVASARASPATSKVHSPDNHGGKIRGINKSKWRKVNFRSMHRSDFVAFLILEKVNVCRLFLGMCCFPEVFEDCACLIIFAHGCISAWQSLGTETCWWGDGEGAQVSLRTLADRVLDQEVWIPDEEERTILLRAIQRLKQKVASESISERQKQFQNFASQAASQIRPRDKSQPIPTRPSNIETNLAEYRLAKGDEVESPPSPRRRGILRASAMCPPAINISDATQLPIHSTTAAAAFGGFSFPPDSDSSPTSPTTLAPGKLPLRLPVKPRASTVSIDHAEEVLEFPGVADKFSLQSNDVEVSSKLNLTDVWMFLQYCPVVFFSQLRFDENQSLRKASKSSSISESSSTAAPIISARSSVARSSVFLRSPRHSLANVFRWKRSEVEQMISNCQSMLSLLCFLCFYIIWMAFAVWWICYVCTNS